MSKHTPGPWEVEDDELGCLSIRRKGFKHPFTGCLVHLMNPSRGFPSGENIHDEMQANARLFAAAPELLAACIQLVQDFETIDSSYPEEPGIELARAAILKATGETV